MGYEQKIYCFVWISSIIAALVKFSKSCENHYTSPEEFEKGWEFLDHVKDNSDIEWKILTTTFKRYWVFLFFQVIVSQFIFQKAKVIFYTLHSLLCLMAIIGIPATLVFVVYITIVYFVHLSGKKGYCYLLLVISLLFIHSSSFRLIKKMLALEETESFLLDVCMAWLLAKSLSFAVDSIDDDGMGPRYVSFSGIMMILAYCLYLPTVFTGPIVAYSEFSKQVLKSPPKFSPKNFSLRLLHLFYQISLYFVYELFLHYFFSSSVQFYPGFVNIFDGWALCGLAYALPMMFYLKYYIIYGLAGSFGRVENITLPPPPKCISCVHLSSYLWRHFDRGLYLWIFRYLYYPIVRDYRPTHRSWLNVDLIPKETVTTVKKLFALSVCFTFVAMWHGMDHPIIVWSSLNCALMASEMAMKFVLTTKFGTDYEKIPAAVKKRISAAIATPHFIMMCISCTFFLSNSDIGYLLISRMLLGGLVPLGTLCIVMYCGCHVSSDFKHWQTENPSSVNLLLNKEDKEDNLYTSEY